MVDIISYYADKYGIEVSMIVRDANDENHIDMTHFKKIHDIS